MPFVVSCSAGLCFVLSRDVWFCEVVCVVLYWDLMCFVLCRVLCCDVCGAALCCVGIMRFVLC